MPFRVFRSAFSLWHLLIVVGAVIILRMIFAYHDIAETFMTGDTDDQMRLVTVRDWLGGQSWFDTRQYRLLPPEGVSMHWSRYVDAGIAAFLAPLSAVFPQIEAEHLTLIIWPSVLLGLLLLIFGWGMARVAGITAAIGAVVAAFVWQRLGGGEFAPGRIDHHNVQLLCASVVGVASIIDARRPWLAGAIGGVAAAMALAVGLEMLPFLLLIWGLSALKLAFDLLGAGLWLAGFALAIGLAAPLLMIGQTPPAEWGVLYCDELAPPVLLLIGLGVIVSLIALGTSRLTRSAIVRVLVMGAATALSLWLASPVLGPCLSGPYGAMTSEARAIIVDRVVEAQPAFLLAKWQPDVVNAILTSALIIVVAATALGWRGWRELTFAQRIALGQMLAIAIIGIVFSMVQIRALNIGVPAIPILAGFVAWQLGRLMQAGHQRLGALLMLAIAVPFVAPSAPLDAGRALVGLFGETEVVANPQVTGEACETQVTADALGELPRSIILSPLNLGTFILAFTAHAATSAPYHRSPDAFLNGVVPFSTEADMRAALKKTGADFVALCRSDLSIGTSAFANQLRNGDLPDFLIRNAASTGDLIVLTADRAAIGQ